MDEQQLSRYERRKQRTRDAIKQSTAVLLVEKGYEALTIQDITDRLDLARATFYVHFRDKDEVIWALLQDSFEVLNVRLSAERTSASGERHYRKLLHIFEYAAEHRALLNVMLGERGHITLIRRLASYVAAVVEKDIESGLTPPARVSVPFTAQFMSGALIQVLTWWLENDTPHTPEQLATMFYELELRSENA
jgi:AcrR family transcriptional regulator